MSKLYNIAPMTLKAAAVYVKENHRHHKSLVGALFALALVRRDTGELVGCAVVGLPKARGLNDKYTAEVVRMCTDGSLNACSKLYAAAWKAARSLGYTRLVTYILHIEPGTSLRAAAWDPRAYVKGRSWNCASRPREDKHPTVDKVRYHAPKSR